MHFVHWLVAHLCRPLTVVMGFQPEGPLYVAGIIVFRSQVCGLARSPNSICPGSQIGAPEPQVLRARQPYSQQF